MIDFFASWWLFKGVNLSDIKNDLRERSAAERLEVRQFLRILELSEDAAFIEEMRRRSQAMTGGRGIISDSVERAARS